jgi:predicted nucleotidyltransferase
MFNFDIMIIQKEIEKKLKALKPTLSKSFYVDKIGYFGSFARNEQTDKSDIDIIVSLNRPLGWAFFDLQALLEKELDRKVDLVSIKALKEQLREPILKEVKYV